MNMNKTQEGQQTKFGQRRSTTILIRTRMVMKKRIIMILIGLLLIKELRLDRVILSLRHLLEAKRVQVLAVIITTTITIIEVRLHLLHRHHHLLRHLRPIISHLHHHHDQLLPIVDLLRILLIRIQLSQVGGDIKLKEVG